MGNQTSKINQYKIVSTYQPDQWTRQHFDSVQELWRNKQTHEVAQIFPLPETPSIQDISRYQVRTNHQYIVKVFNIAINNNEPACVTNQHALLLIQYIPIRLSQIKTLDLQEALTVLHSAFRGFHTLQHLFGVVQPNQELICFNEEGKTKVWLNSDLNRNYPSQVPFQASISNQHIRVKKVVQFIFQKVGPNPIFLRLKQKLLEENAFYFEASIIIQEFVFREELSLKRYIRTDILLRRFNLASNLDQNISPFNHHNRHPTSTTIIPTERSIHPFRNTIQPVRKVSNSATSQIIRVERIQSCEKLDSIRNSIRSIAFQPSQPQINSRIQSPIMQNSRIYQGFRSIPKIVFHHRQNSGLCNEMKVNAPKISFVVPSSLSSRVQLMTPVRKNEVQQNKIKLLENIEGSNKTEKKNNLSFNQIVKISIHQEQEQSSVPEKKDQPQNNQPLYENSIIGVIENDIQCKKQKQTEQHICNTQNKQSIQLNQSIVPVEEIQVSGMFKPIDELQSKQRPQKPYNMIDSIKETNIITNDSSSFSQKIETKEKKQMPIKFESFAPTNKLELDNISFAPKNQQLRQSQKNFDPFNKQITSKSLNIQQNEGEQVDQELQVASSSSSQETINNTKKLARLIQSQERVITKHQDDTNNQYSKEQLKQDFRKIISDQRASIDTEQLLDPHQNRPFYQNYTPVESKFDVIIKKDSNLAKEEEGDEPTYVNIDDEKEYQKYIKNKFKEMFPIDNTVRMNRVVSQYQGNPRHMNYQQQIKHTRGQTQHGGQVKSYNKNKVSNIHEQEQDFLDVKNLEKSLSKKYKQQPSNEKTIHHQDQFDVAKLEEGLLRFSSRKLSNQENQDISLHKPHEESIVQPFDPFGTQNTCAQKIVHRSSQNNQQLTIKKRKEDTYNLLNEQKNNQIYYTNNLQKQYSFNNTSNDGVYSRNKQINKYMSSTDSYGKYLSTYGSQLPNKYESNYTSNYKTDYSTNYFGNTSNQGRNYGNLYVQNIVYNQKPKRTVQMYRGERYIKVNKDNHYPKQADNLLQQRYNKYVKHSNFLTKKRSYDSLASAASNKNLLNIQKSSEKDQQMPSFGKKKQQTNKRVSYDNLRAILWN